MKMKAFVKSVIAVAFMFIGSLAIEAVSPRNYMYDTKEEDGKIVSKIVYLNNEGLLNREVKYEFAYNEEGKVVEKKAYRWNQKTEDWDNYYLITYQYEEGADTFMSEYGLWNKKKNDFSINTLKMIIPMENYDTIFS